MDPVRVRHRRRDGSTEVVAAPVAEPANISSSANSTAFAGAERFQLKVEYRAIEELSRNPRNPRTHSEKQIAKMAASIKQFGFVVPVLVDERGQVLAGHGRLEAAKQIGMTNVPVICLAHLTKEEKRAYAIADNRLAELAGWDNEILAVELTDLLKIDDFEIEATGFDMVDIDSIIGEAETVDEEPEDLSPTTEKPVTRLGDLWLLGEHRLCCGDARDEESFRTLLAGQLAQMVFTDPPYNVEITRVTGLGKVKHREFAMASGEMTKPEFTDFLTTVFRNLARSSVDGSIHDICMDWRHIEEVMAAGCQVYDELKNLCVWAKDNGGMGTFYRSQHELVFVYKYGQAAHINNFGLGEGGRYRTNVWSYSGVNTLKRGWAEELAMHPKCKPETSDEDWARMLDFNVRGPLRVIRKFVPPMIKQRSGSIINVVSSGVLAFSHGGAYTALRPGSREMPYMASKAALANMSFYLADEIKEHNVAANVFFPGHTRSSWFDDTVRYRVAAGMPPGLRPVAPEHAVPLTLFLASQDAKGTTGKMFDAMVCNQEHGFGGYDTWIDQSLPEDLVRAFAAAKK